MKLIVSLLFAVAACAALCQEPTKHDNPGSLWPDSAVDNLRDHTACKVGDILTVVIIEASQTSFTAQTTTAKSDSASVNQGIGPILRNLIPSLAVGSGATTNGSGSTSQAGTFTATMTVTVKKILPNGTLMIEGTRNITTNRDTQNIKLTGTIRHEDIRPDNTILSSSIADAEIKATGKGQISDRQRKGLLIRLIDWLF
jgi:flagellar L-ring protein precursor FlgH